MKKYKIMVNGRCYDVEVEEVSGSPRASTPVVTRPAQPVFPPKPTAVVNPTTGSSKPETKEKAPGLIKSPLPGVIVNVLAQPGKSFSKGETLLTVEAMKMENEILAPYNCLVQEVFVAPAKAVQTGDPLIRIAQK